MSAATGIQWTDRTWNPGIYGCDEVSPGCANCYAATMAYRLESMGQEPYAGTTAPVPAGGRRWTGEVTVAPTDKLLKAPLRWKRPQRVFVNSMSDLFHEDVPEDYLDAVFAIMAYTRSHTFQILTKRAERMREYVNGLTPERLRDASRRLFEGRLPYFPSAAAGTYRLPLSNVWLGVSAERQQEADYRVPLLLDTPAAIRFVSAEPLLGPTRYGTYLYPDRWHDDDTRLDWIIVGGESGPKARPMDLAWPRAIVDECRAAGVAVFVKQLGAKPVLNLGTPIEGPVGRELEGQSRSWAPLKGQGGNIEEWPEDLRVREFPA